MDTLKKRVADRLVVFDLLRGYFVLVLIIDHLERWPGIFDWITGQAKLWSTAAEGFFIVSGIMIGLIRGRKALDKPLKLVSKILFERGLQLYLWAILSSLFFTLYGILWFTHFPDTQRIPYGLFPFPTDNPWQLILQTFTLEYSHGWTGFLKYYAIFIFLAPVVIWLLRKGLWWLVLLASVAIWLWGLNKDSWWLSWQLLFYGGAVAGFYAPRIRDWWQHKTTAFRKATKSIVWSLSFITVAVSVFFTFGWSIVQQPNNPIMSFDQFDQTKKMIDPYFHIVTLQPLRLTVTLLWFTALLLLFSHFQAWLLRWMGWLLMTFGQNSLYVYILHGVFVYTLDLILPTREYFLLNVSLIIGTTLALWYMAKKQLFGNIIPR